MVRAGEVEESLGARLNALIVVELRAIVRSDSLEGSIVFLDNLDYPPVK
jgi:hypothetical protein